MHGVRLQTSAASGVLVVALCVLGTAATVGASTSERLTRSDAGPASAAAAVADEAKAAREERRAEAEEAKAMAEERRAVAELQEAHDMAAASVGAQQKANEEQHTAAAEGDPTTAAQLEGAAARDAEVASSDRAVAAQELRRARAEMSEAERDEEAAAEDRAKAERDAARAVHEQERAQRQAAAAGKILICHASSSARNPYVEIEVDRSGLNGHSAHPADLIPAPAGGCPRTALAVRLDEAKGIGPLELVKDAAQEMAKAAELAKRADAEAAKARQEERLAQNEMKAARGEAAGARATEKRADQEHQAAARETDPTKAGALEQAAVGDDRLADSQQLLSKIDKSLAELETALAKQDAARARGDGSKADLERAAAEEGQQEAQEQAEASGKILICHATRSSGNPYVEIEVAEDGLSGHGDHAGDIIPASAMGCPAAAGARAAERTEADDARTRVPLPSGPVEAVMTANESSIASGGTVRLALAAVNLRTTPARDVELCTEVPAGFSVVSAPGARLVEGAPCRTVVRLAAMSVATLSVHLRLNDRVGRGARVRLPLVLAVGSKRAPRVHIELRVTTGIVPAGAPPVTG